MIPWGDGGGGFDSSVRRVGAVGGHAPWARQNGGINPGGGFPGGGFGNPRGGGIGLGFAPGGPPGRGGWGSPGPGPGPMPLPPSPSGPGPFGGELSGWGRRNQGAAGVEGGPPPAEDPSGPFWPGGRSNPGPMPPPWQSRPGQMEMPWGKGPGGVNPGWSPGRDFPGGGLGPAPGFAPGERNPNGGHLPLPGSEGGPIGPPRPGGWTEQSNFQQPTESQPWGGDYSGWLRKRLLSGNAEPMTPTESQVDPGPAGPVATAAPGWNWRS